MGLTSNKMFTKVIVLFTLLAVILAEKPRVGFRVSVLPSSQILPQVIGGSEAPKGAYPHIVSLQWGFDGNNIQHFCAGSILNENWILTAGHCLLAVPSYGAFQIKAGKHNIKISEVNEQTVRVVKSIVHEQYKGGVGPYDIGLIKLRSPLAMTPEIQSIELPGAGSEPTGKAILAGWGSISTNDSPIMPNNLQHVNLTYIDLSTCNDAVKRLTGSSPPILHETNICTGPLTGGIGSCHGDSGGPLINKRGKPVLTGITSWGIVPCGTYGAPSVYTKVSHFIEWIKEKIADN